MTIVESTLKEVRREKPSFAEKTRFQGEIGVLKTEDSIAKYDSKAEKLHL